MSAPLQPSPPTLKFRSDNELQLIWQDNPPKESYKLLIEENGITLADISLTKSPGILTALKANSCYRIRLVAINIDGASPPSSTTVAWTALPQPTSRAALFSGTWDQSVNVTWDLTNDFNLTPNNSDMFVQIGRAISPHSPKELIGYGTITGLFIDLTATLGNIFYFLRFVQVNPGVTGGENLSNWSDHSEIFNTIRPPTITPKQTLPSESIGFNTYRFGADMRSDGGGGESSGGGDGGGDGGGGGRHEGSWDENNQDDRNDEFTSDDGGDGGNSVVERTETITSYNDGSVEVSRIERDAAGNRVETRISRDSAGNVHGTMTKYDSSNRVTERSEMRRSPRGDYSSTYDKYDSNGQTLDHRTYMESPSIRENKNPTLVRGPDGGFTVVQPGTSNTDRFQTPRPAVQRDNRPNQHNESSNQRPEDRSENGPRENRDLIPERPSGTNAQERPTRNNRNNTTIPSPSTGGRQGNPQFDSRLSTILSELQRRFPDARIRQTDGVRTVEQQAGLMATRAMQNPTDFMANYGAGAYATQMLAWLRNNPNLTHPQVTNHFVEVINQARAGGAYVSNHIASPNQPATAMDISMPRGGTAVQREVENAIRELGGSVNREPNAPTGPHIHFSVPRRRNGRRP